MIETLLIVVILVGITIALMQRPQKFPPGPTPLPFLGNFLSIDHCNPQDSWKVFHKKFGDVVGIIVPYYKIIVVSGWQSIKEALSNEDLNGRPDVNLLRDRFEDHGRYGMVFYDGPDWKAQRKFTLHHFRNLGFGRKSHEYVIHEEIEAFIQELNGLKNVPIAMEERFTLSAINITWCLLGGKRYRRSDPLLKQLAFHVKESMHSVNTIGSPAIVFPFLRHMFPVTSGYKEIKTGCKGIMKFVREVIDEHKKRSSSEETPDDFIGIYLKEMKDNPQADKSFSMRQLEGLCMDLLSAGGDTSSSVLSFAILFLSQNQEMQEKMSKELKNYLGTEQIPNIDDRPNLVYTDAFLHEVLRFRSVTPTFPPHRALRDTNISGYLIPKDSVICFNHEAVLMDPEYWSDPETFRPERFIDEEGKLKKEERLITFGKGKRSCLGEMLAKMTTFLLFSSLVHNFHFKFSPEGEPKETKSVPGFTYSAPKYHVLVTPRRESTCDL